MTPPLQPHLSTSLRLQLLLLATVGYKSAWSHSFNFTLMFVSCDSELLQNVDDIAIVGVIDTQGHGQRDTVYSLLVESTFDNQSFVHICSTEFKSSDCVNSTSYGCYCREAVDGGNRLHVVIRQRADQTTATHYRLRINSKDSKNETWIFVPVPSIYDNVKTVTQVVSLEATPRVIPIVIGSLLSLFFFVTVVIYLCDGIQVGSAVRLSRRTKSCEHSLAETRSTHGSSRPVRFAQQKDSQDKRSMESPDFPYRDNPDTLTSTSTSIS
ncbi:hypothetical protein BsWGS_16912 [Bradybaena similaris]